jgi:hypothetical protein
MGRPISTAIETFGEVTISIGKGGVGFRVRWTDPSGRRKECTARTLVQAREIAHEAAGRVANPDTINADMSFGALVGAFLNPDGAVLGKDHASTVRRCFTMPRRRMGRPRGRARRSRSNASTSKLARAIGPWSSLVPGSVRNTTASPSSA